MRRRDFIVAICGASLAWPGAAAGEQPGEVWRIGQVVVTTPERGSFLVQALEQDLADLGEVSGRNIVLSTRFAGSELGKVQEAISSLLPQIDLLVVWGTV